jgi:peptidoglycan hydrolase-like protein with peptidoglycan-binding domain
MMRGPASSPRKKGLRTTVIVGSTVLAVAAVVVASVGLGGNASTPPASTGPSLATAVVTRTTLRQTQQVNGTLGYGVPVRVKATGHGTVTWLPALGAVLRRGQAVYQVDSQPVSLFYGTRPFYRPLRTGDSGEDVREVEQNLAALGYTGFAVDTKYTASTATALRKWQKDRGLTQNGAFDPARVVLAPGALRVASLAVAPGDPAGGEILSYSGTTRLVRVALDVALQSLAAKGSPATVTLPNGTSVDGTVASVGTVATAGHAPSDPATIDVSVSLANQSGLGSLDEAPVTVTLVAASVSNVLTVPVAALVALADGGTGVQVISGSTSRYVTVQLGMFGNGRVQVDGAGIAEGTLVAVPS